MYLQCLSQFLLMATHLVFLGLKKGVRQGDPLSPFLFVLAAEVLARLIEKEASCNAIQGFKLA